MKQLTIKRLLFQKCREKYRITSNKRPTSRKRLPRINAPFFLILFYKRPLRINAPFSNSFKSCGLNLNTNGSEDGLIHCFKEDEPCQNGREHLISQLDVLDEPDRPNPFNLIRDSDVDEADNAVFRIEEDDEIIDVDI